MPRKPIIGITTAYDFERNTSNLKDDYYDAVVQAGAVPILVPVVEEKNIWMSYLNLCDGFILSGGPDIDAAYFGKSNMPYANEISPVRDEMEIFITKQAIEMNKPLLGICRGCQVINVAAGGSIFQDIYAENSSDKAILKHSQQAPRWFEIHEVAVREATCLHSIFESFSLRVNSFHHQAVSEVAPGFIVNACSEDGIIEAISREDKKFVLGVQWHPENLWRKNKIHLKLFERLVAVC